MQLKHLLKISDLDKQGIDVLLDRAIELKTRHLSGIPYQPFKGKTLGLVFDKSSTRTRVSFEVAMHQFGGSAIFISQKDSQTGRGEPVKDTARVMSRYVDALVVRTFGHEIVEEYARYSTVPVINGLTNEHHPCQILADIMTVIEKKGGYKGLRFCWVGDGNNMANSWIEAAAILGFDLALACPKGYKPDLNALGVTGCGNVKVVDSPLEAAKGADVLNTDVWASMGQEEESEKRRVDFKGFQIDSALLASANKGALVMHCLPAHRGEEITDEVIEGANSVVWDEAENRLYAQKAILEKLLLG